MSDSGNLFFDLLNALDGSSLTAQTERLTVAPGQVFYEAEDTIDQIYFPTKGLIHVVSVMLSGDSVETSVVGREGAVGFIEATGSGVMFSRCLAQVPGEVLRVPARMYRQAFDGSPAVRAAVSDHVELLITEARQAIACQAKHPASARLAWWLLECQDRLGGQTDLPLTQDFLATMMGVQRTTVTEFAGQLADRGVIRTRRGHVHVIDRIGLQGMACECYATARNFRQMIAGKREAAINGLLEVGSAATGPDRGDVADRRADQR